MSAHRLQATIVRFIEQLVSKFDLAALYPCTVVAQNGDGTLDLRPDAADFGPGLSRVPIRLGVPGAKAKVKAGARVLLAFEALDPRKPIATLWEPSEFVEVDFMGGGGLPIARQGDIVGVAGATTFVSFVGQTPMVAGVPYKMIFTSVTSPVPSPTLYGTIITGRKKLKA